MDRGITTSVNIFHSCALPLLSLALVFPVWAFTFFKKNNLFLFFGCAGSSLLHGLFCSCGDWGLLSHCSVRASCCSGVLCCRALGSGLASFSNCGSWALKHGLHSHGTEASCSAACGILPVQGWNPCLLHWPADSLSLSRQGSPTFTFLKWEL